MGVRVGLEDHGGRWSDREVGVWLFFFSFVLSSLFCFSFFFSDGVVLSF